MHSTDVWSEWLLHRRHADDPNYGSSTRATPQSVQLLPRGLSVGFSKRF